MGQNTVLLHNNGTSDFYIKITNLDSKCIHSEADNNWHNANRRWDNILHDDA